ncbi:hypothetical protein CsSME_00051509 [Camellia sinensis var. sinensis]
MSRFGQTTEEKLTVRIWFSCGDLEVGCLPEHSRNFSMIPVMCSLKNLMFNC